MTGAEAAVEVRGSSLISSLTNKLGKAAIYFKVSGRITVRPKDQPATQVSSFRNSSQIFLQYAYTREDFQAFVERFAYTIPAVDGE